MCTCARLCVRLCTRAWLYLPENIVTVCTANVCISVRQTSRKNCISEGKSNIVLQGSDSHKINLLSCGAAATDDTRGSTIPSAHCGLRDIWPFTELADTNRIRPGRQMKATSGEMRAVPPARESLAGGGMDFLLCLKT